MKKFLKILAVFVVFFFSINSAEAFSTDTSIVYTKTRADTIRINSLRLTNGSSSKSYSTYLYNMVGNGETYITYCMDPHKPAATYYTLDRILGDASYSGGVRAFDYGMLEILKHAYTQINNEFTTSDATPETTPDPFVTTLTGEKLYAAARIAIVSLNSAVFGWAGRGLNDQSMRATASSYLTRGTYWAQWREDIAVFTGTTGTTPSERYKQIINRNEQYYTWYMSDWDFTGWSYGNDAYDVIYAAKELFDIGLDAAVDFVENGRVESSISGSVTSTVQDGQRTEDEVQEYVYINMDLVDFAEDAYVNNFNFTCSNCSSSGVTYDYMEYYNAENEWVRLTSDVDISKVLTPDEDGIRSGTVRIRVHFTKQVLDEENCSNASFTVTYDYYDPNKQYIGALLKNKNGDYQRMLVIDEVSGNVNSDGVPGSVGCANPVCDTQLSVPICSDDEDEAISEIYAPENIKKCVLDNQDDAGNNYNLVEDSGGVSEDNAYCQVFCKEDYFDVIQEDGGNVLGGIKLNPEIEDVNCGGYFQLTAHVEGKKDCYTSGGTKDKEINREQYIADITEAQITMINAYNEYLRWQTAYDSVPETDSNKYHSLETDPYTCCPEPPATGSCSCGCGIDGYCVGYNISGEVTGFSYSDNGDGTLTISRNQTLSYSYTDDGGRSASGCGGSCSSGSTSTLKRNLKDDYLDPAIDALNTAISKYEQIIASYNSCTTNWTNEYPFEQKLSFYYSEYQGNEDYSPYYDLISAAGDPDLYYLDPVDESLVEEYEIEICLDGTTSEYECEGRPYNYEEMDVTLGTYNYSQDYSEVFEHQDYIKCSESGCSIDPDAYVSNATFVKKTVKKSQDYITPTVFYQIEANGRITVNSGYTGNALTLDALINALPISTRATGGGVFKLMLEDLGEFYDPSDAVTQADNLGRLIDYGRSEVDGVNHVRGDNYDKSVAVAVGREGIETFTGDYTCYYYSDCRTEDCPDCDFVCEEGECEWVYCPDCEFDCVNCIFNLDELQINFKPISTVDVESANRDLGYNWNVNTTLEALELLRDKASLTIQEIETENETIYNKTGDDSELDFSIRLNSEIINYLKEYNGSVEDEGGYANDSLTCYSATIDGKNFANIFCYSDVLDDLYDQYEDQITFAPGRISRGQRNVDSDGSSNANANGYWSLWSGWTESEKVNGQYSVIGGPSWK